VRLAGIEPTTPWFVAKYSIQLSYSRTGAHLNMQKASTDSNPYKINVN
jgi:transcription elongation factor GreB